MQIRTGWRYYLIVGCLLAIALSIILILPQYLSNYFMSIANICMIYLLVVLSATVMYGLCGMMSFCNVSIMGLSAFITAQLAKNYGMNGLFSILFAVIVTTIFFGILGRALVRLRGVYFVFGTIGLCNMMDVIYSNFRPLIDSADGIFGYANLQLFGHTFDGYTDWFYLSAAVALLVVLFVERIRHSSLGRSFMAVRDNSVTAAVFGVNEERTKWMAFLIGTMIAALAGSLWCYLKMVVSCDWFTFDKQLDLQLALMLGGMDSTGGALIGTFLVQIMPELLRGFARYLRIIRGVLLILLMIFMPTGLAGVVRILRQKIRSAIIRKGGGGNASTGAKS